MWQALAYVDDMQGVLCAMQGAGARVPYSLRCSAAQRKPRRLLHQRVEHASKTTKQTFPLKFVF
jgi:hypothetical protein